MTLDKQTMLLVALNELFQSRQLPVFYVNITGTDLVAPTPNRRWV